MAPARRKPRKETLAQVNERIARARLKAKKPEWQVKQDQAHQAEHVAKAAALRAEQKRKMAGASAEPRPKRPAPKLRKPRTGGDFQGRPVGRKWGQVREMLPGELVRFSHSGRHGVAGTVIEHTKTKKGVWRSLVHVHSTGEIIHVPHRQVTDTKKVRSKKQRLVHLRNARTSALAHRAETQNLHHWDANRLMAAGRATKVDKVLRDQGVDVPAIEPKQPAPEPPTRGGLNERAPEDKLAPDRRVEHERIARVPSPPFEKGSFQFLSTPVAEAHPSHLRVGDDALFYLPQPGRRGLADFAQGEGVGTGHHGIVIGHNKRANLLHVYDTADRRIRLVPYGHVHHVRHLPRSERMLRIRSRIGGKHRAPALAQARADTSRHRRLTDIEGAPAYFRTPTYESRNGAFAHGGTAYPSAAGDTYGELYDFGRGAHELAADAVGYKGPLEQINPRQMPVHAMGGLEPYIELTAADGDFRPPAGRRNAGRGEALLRESVGPAHLRHLIHPALDAIGIDPYDVDLKKLEAHARMHEATPRSRLKIGSPCARHRRIDFAVHRLLPGLLQEKHPELARRLIRTSPRWGRLSHPSGAVSLPKMIEAAATHECPHCGHKLLSAAHRGFTPAEAKGPGQYSWRCPTCHRDLAPLHNRPVRLGEARWGGAQYRGPVIFMADDREDYEHEIKQHRMKARRHAGAAKYFDRPHPNDDRKLNDDARKNWARHHRGLARQHHAEAKRLSRELRLAQVRGIRGAHLGEAKKPGVDEKRRLENEVPFLEAGVKHDGAMIALYPPPALAHKLAIPRGEEPAQLHVTLAFLGKASELSDPAKLTRIVAGWAAATPPLHGKITGLKLFNPGPHSEGKIVTNAGVSVHGLHASRDALAHALITGGQPVATNFPFEPHLCLAYGDHRNIELPDHPVTFDRVTLKLGEDRREFTLAGKPLVRAA